MSEFKLSDLEMKIFKAWLGTDDDFDVLSFKCVSNRSGVDISKVRAAVRRLARKGVTRFVRVSWTDDGEIRGAGYGLTKEGRHYRNNLDESYVDA